MLQGGHPDSLGRTVEVVDVVLAEPKRLDEHFRCTFSDDEIVRRSVAAKARKLGIVRAP